MVPMILLWANELDSSNHSVTKVTIEKQEAAQSSARSKRSEITKKRGHRRMITNKYLHRDCFYYSPSTAQTVSTERRSARWWWERRSREERWSNSRRVSSDSFLLGGYGQVLKIMMRSNCCLRCFVLERQRNVKPLLRKLFENQNQSECHLWVLPYSITVAPPWYVLYRWTVLVPSSTTIVRI